MGAAAGLGVGGLVGRVRQSENQSRQSKEVSS